MFRLRRCGFAIAFSSAMAMAYAAAPTPGDLILPPLDGELTGELNATLLGGAPRVKWKLNVRTDKPRERTVEFSIEGQGISVRGDARLDPIGEGTWRIAEAAIDLGEWFGWVAPHLSPVVQGTAAAGALNVRGEGTWRGGVLGGSANISLREGRIDDTVRKVLIEGISVDINITDLAARRT